MSVQVSYKKQIILGIILLVIFLVVIEVIVNIWLYNFYRCDFEDNEIFSNMAPELKRQMCLESLGNEFVDERIMWEEGTRVEERYGGWDENIVNFNSEGFRGSEFTKEKSEDVYRIFITGGSTTIGMGVFDNQTYPYYLQQMFNEVNLGKRVEVINIGWPGWSSLDEVKIIKTKFIEYNPNLFIVYDGWNDTLLTIRDHPKGSATQWKERWIEICELGKQSGFDTIIILQPMLGTGNKVLTNQERERLTFKNTQQIMEVYPSFVKQISDLKNNCTGVSDFRNIFDNTQKPIYFDAGHTSPLGNQIIAKNLYHLSLPIIRTNLVSDGNEKDSSFISDTDLSLILNDFEDPWEELEITLRTIISPYKTPRIFSLIFEN